jgi:hypothetical protein
VTWAHELAMGAGCFGKTRRVWSRCTLAIGLATAFAACGDGSNLGWTDEPSPGGGGGASGSKATGGNQTGGNQTGGNQTGAAGSSTTAGTGAVPSSGGQAGAGPEPGPGGHAGDGGASPGAAGLGGEEALGGAAGAGPGNAAAGAGGDASGDGGGGDDGTGSGDGGLLGRPCTGDLDCTSVSEAGLHCLKPSSTALDGGGPPGGLCTRKCQSDSDCDSHAAGALCYPFSDTASYCVEGCSFGDPEPGHDKCHNRADFACAPAMLGNTNDACGVATPCFEGELCSSGTCHVVFPGCLPSCRGDIDCGAGLYCDQSFLSGVCVKKKPTGKRLGEPCLVPGAHEPAERDECLGFCQPDQPGATTGHCGASCPLLGGCAWDAGSERFDGACVYLNTWTSSAAAGDLGYCAQACDCSAQCDDGALMCTLFGDDALPSNFNGDGLCLTAEPELEELDACAPL